MILFIIVEKSLNWFFLVYYIDLFIINNNGFYTQLCLHYWIRNNNKENTWFCSLQLETPRNYKTQMNRSKKFFYLKSLL